MWRSHCACRIDTFVDARSLGKSRGVEKVSTRHATGVRHISMPTWRGPPDLLRRQSCRLVLTALALSIDNLVVGFGLGVTKIPLVLALLVFAVVSVALSLAGLEVGRRLGARMQRRSDELAGLVLIAVGILVAANVF